MREENSSIPKVSIILAAHGDAPWLKYAIDSIIGQSFSDWELICVLDAVNDSVSALVNAHDRDERISSLAFLENLGAAAARNEGLRKAKGELIAILDSDDVWGDEHLQICVDFLDMNPDIMMLGTSYRVIDECGSITGIEVLAPRSMLRQRLAIRNCFAHSSVVFRREIAIEAGGYPAGIMIGEDYCLWLRIASLGKISNVEKVTVSYRIHGKQTSKTPIDKTSSEQIMQRKIELASTIYVPKWCVSLSHKLWLKRRNAKGASY